MMGFGWGMGADGWLWMFGGLILVIGIVILLMRGMGGNERTADRPLGTSPRQEPMEILRARFARGVGSSRRQAASGLRLDVSP